MAYTASYDIVIIGGGTAGLALASRLTEDTNVSVVVLEAGEDHQADPRVSTPAMWPTLLKSELDWDFQSTPQAALGDRVLGCPAGKALGGTSSTNSFLFCPTSKSHVDAWSRLGNAGHWDWSAISQGIEATRTAVQLNTLDINDADHTWLKVWTETIETLGYPVCDVFSGEVCGSAVTPETVNPATGQRFSSVTAYLDPARQRSNLTVVTGATVTKVILARDDSGLVVAEGVEYTLPGQPEPISVKAHKEVVVAAGAMSSPRILELSGIGDKTRLESVGVDVYVDNPHVGENLQNHVLVGSSFELKEDSDMPSRDPLNRQDPAAIQAAMGRAATGKGPLTTSANNAYAQIPLPQTLRGEVRELTETLRGPDDKITTAEFTNAHETFVRSVLTSSTDVPIIYMSTNTYLPFDGSDPTYRAPGKWYSVAVMLAHPLSKGSVHITSKSSTAPVEIDAGFLSHPLDAEVLARGLRFAKHTLVSTQPLKSHLKDVEQKKLSHEEELEYVRNTASGGNHWVGSCAMMSRELGGVVDPQLRVYGCQNLRVCDASVVPLVPRGNTQVLVYAVAEIAAGLIRANL